MFWQDFMNTLLMSVKIIRSAEAIFPSATGFLAFERPYMSENMLSVHFMTLARNAVLRKENNITCALNGIA